MTAPARSRAAGTRARRNRPERKARPAAPVPACRVRVGWSLAWGRHSAVVLATEAIAGSVLLTVATPFGVEVAEVGARRTVHRLV